MKPGLTQRSSHRPRSLRVAAACAALAGAAALTVSVRRVAVEGDSMRPSLEPGDRVVVVRLPRVVPVRRGWLLAVRDPRLPSRLLVKRASAPAPGGVYVLGDNPEHSTDSRTFGLVPHRSVVGLVVYRYAPPGRAGWVR